MSLKSVFVTYTKPITYIPLKFYQCVIRQTRAQAHEQTPLKTVPALRDRVTVVIT